MVQIEIIGNLGADVREVDYNGNKFYTFNVCDNRKVNGQTVSQWFSCNLNRQSEILQYLVKGQQVFVRGVPAFRIIDSAKYHMKMVSVDVFVNEIQLVGAAPKSEAADAATDQEAAPAAGEAPAETAPVAAAAPADAAPAVGAAPAEAAPAATGEKPKSNPRSKKNG